MTDDGPLGYDVAYPRALLSVLAMVVLVGIVIAASTSGTAFGVYNARWDGASELRRTAEGTGADATLLRNASRYRTLDASGSVALILSPDSSYSQSQRAALRRFVREGGTLVVAEDVGPHGNHLLRAVGAIARFDGGLLRDEQHNFRTPAMPVATNVPGEGPLTENVSQLTLNRGTVVEPGNATVLVRSSGFAYVDRNDDGAPDDSETLRRWPVVTVESVGDGRVVAVADPSLFINVMLDQPANRRFARTLFGSGQRVYLDYSHTADIPVLQAVLLTVRRTPVLQVFAGLGALAVLAAGQRGVLAGAWQRIRTEARSERQPGPAVASPADLAAYLRERHPDWDDERVRRVAGAAMADDDSPGE